MRSRNAGLDDDFMANMLGDFLDESQGYLSQLNDNLLALDELVRSLDDEAKAPVDVDMLNEMFRAAHSLKGLSAMLRLAEINGLTHKIENVFDAARHDHIAIDRAVVDVMFDAFDRLAGMIDQLRNPNAADVEFESVAADIQRLLEQAGAERLSEMSAEMKQALSGHATTGAIESESADHGVDDNANDVDDENAAENPSDAIASRPIIDDPFVNVSDESEIPRKYLSIFVDETDESLDSLAEMLLSDVSEVAVDPLLVICHRIKGAAASIGLNRIAKLSHFMEDFLQELREAQRDPTNEVVDAFLFAVDALRSSVQSIRNGERGSVAFRDAYRMLVKTRNSMFSSPTEPNRALAPAQEAAPLDDAERSRIAMIAPPGGVAMVGCAIFEPELPLAELKARMIYERLALLGELFHCDPAESQLDDISHLTCVTFGVISDRSIEEISADINLSGVAIVDLVVVSSAPSVSNPRPDKTASQTPAPAPAATAPPRASTPVTSPPADSSSDTSDDGEATRGKSKPAETLRVDIDRLDHLMNLAGQLVINKARFGQIGDKLKGLATCKQSTHSLTSISSSLDSLLLDMDECDDSQSAVSPMLQSLRGHVQKIRRDMEIVCHDVAQLSQARTMVGELSEAIHQLDRVTDGIQKSVMDTRMVPIGPLFGRFRRVIRDITRGNGKDVQLAIRGEKTELDKRMIDELGDPLIHMVRNSADHGIESPDERVAAGKPRQGTVTLDAFHRGNRIFIQVRDDGRGLDAEKLKAKALDKGIISPQDAERLTTHQIYQLIWEPGFSTAEQVTEVSGRGMGMDIVRSKIEQLSGTVELDSQPGKGTTITIKLPLTMAILPSLLTLISGDVFAIPVESVIEIVRLNAGDLSTVHGMKTATVRGRVISVVQLDDLFNWNEQIESPASNDGDSTIVIVGAEGEELGLAVDGLIGEQDIVIKSMADNYRNVHGIVGASILGDGRVSLILDVSALMGMACRKVASVEQEAAVA